MIEQYWWQPLHDVPTDDKQAYRAMNGKTFDQSSAKVARQQVLDRIEQACRSSARATDSVRLLAVSKTFGYEKLLAMADTGQIAFGENYLQEALEKQQAIKNERPDLNLEWHFIGPIQSNKTKPIAENFDWVHTIDREKIAKRLSDQRPQTHAPLQVCLQINIDDESTKSGCTPADAPALAAAIGQLPNLNLRGLMAIPAPTDDPQKQSEAFGAVQKIFNELQTNLQASDPSGASRFDTLSMGMTADLESAIAQGSTIVRVGTALFGTRAKRV